MNGLSQHQSVFRIAKQDAAANTGHARAKKRNRQTVSCQACRARKLKCDRQLPCLACSKRGDTTACCYDDDSLSARDRQEGSYKASEAQLRLQKLEAMVTSLMQAPGGGSSSASSSDIFSHPSVQSSISQSSTEQVSKAPPTGHLDAWGSQTNYVGGTHWATVLENIRDLQDCLEVNVEASDEQQTKARAKGPDLVIGPFQPLTMVDVCNMVPPKSVTDRLLSVYFNSKQIQFLRRSGLPIPEGDADSLLALTHTGKFLREYEAFWTDPSSVSFLWISMLSSVLFVASQVSQMSGRDISEYSNESGRKVLFTLAGQALIAGDYQMAKPYCVEAILFYTVCKFTQQEDPNSDVWLLMGVAARLAMKMGYHRDPSQFPRISPFEGEMRRRVFFYVHTFDLLLSFQAGLPTIIREEECDAEPPSNLLDSDFDEDTKALPPSRPTTDPTPMLYFRTKGHLLKMFRRVFRLVMSFEPYSYEDIMRLDRGLNEARDKIPPILRNRPLSSSITDPLEIILDRRNLETMYLKVTCILHRRYLTHDRLNPAFEYSRKTCTNAALRLLELQVELQIACQPGGRLYEDRWMMTSITQQDFLLAAMITCLDLHEASKTLATASFEEKQAHAKQYDALKCSHGIWMSRDELSPDAQRATRMISVMLSKISRPDVESHDIKPSQAFSMNPQQPDANPVSVVGLNLHPSQNVPWNCTTFDTSSNEFSLDTYGTIDINMMSPIDNIFSEPENFDWGLIDQGLLGRQQNSEFTFDWQVSNSA